MKIEYQSIKMDEDPLNKNYNFIIDGIHAGSIEGKLCLDNIYISVVNIFPEFQRKVIGYEVFKTVFNEINDVEEIKIFRAVWCSDEQYNHCKNGMSTNLHEFKKHRETKTEKESVFLTPTGKWVSKLSFTNIQSIRVTDSEVTVDLIK